MFRGPARWETRAEMEKEQLSPGQPDHAGAPPPEDLSIDLESTHELAQKGQKLLEVSKELTSSSKALLEQIDAPV